LSHSVIMDPLGEVHGWSKGTVSSAITLFFFANGVAGFMVGRWVDRYGPKWFLVLGSIVFGIGLSALNWVHTIPQLYFCYLVMSAGFCTTALIPVNTLVTNWFIKNRGLAMSITNTGLSVGGVIMVPLASYFIIHYGLNKALYILGGVYALVIIPITVFFVKQKPSDVGQCPDGNRACRMLHAKDHQRGDFDQMQVWTRWQAFKTAAFWAIALAFLLVLAGQIAFLIHMVSFFSQYLGPQMAAVTVSITSCASIIGRLVLGSFVDRCSKRHVAMVCFFIQGMAVFLLAHYNHAIFLYICTFAFGLTMGPILMLQSLIIGECFGIPSFATVSGAIGLFSMPGAAFGPMIAGVIFDASQNYQSAFVLFAAASFLAIVVIYFARPPKNPC